MQPEIIHRYLPIQCYGSRLNGYHPFEINIGGIAQHYFSGRWAFPDDPYDMEKCWRLMHDLNFEKKDRLFGLYDGDRFSASAQFMIGRAGELWQLVPLAFQAFHAGPSAFGGREHCNAFMVGIENIGIHGRAFTRAQYITNAKLCAWLMWLYNFPVDMIAGHSDIALPEGRKKDPGPSFDWELLFELIQQFTREYYDGLSQH